MCTLSRARAGRPESSQQQSRQANLKPPPPPAPVSELRYDPAKCTAALASAGPSHQRRGTLSLSASPTTYHTWSWAGPGCLACDGSLSRVKRLRLPAPEVWAGLGKRKRGPGEGGARQELETDWAGSATIRPKPTYLRQTILANTQHT